jgi:hypothetical protein
LSFYNDSPSVVIFARGFISILGPGYRTSSNI